MKTVAIVSQKGGSGKTTIAVHLAVCAELHKKRAAIIDLDPQASALEWYSRRDAETPEVIKATPEQLPALVNQAKANHAGFTIIDTAPHSDRSAVVAANIADLILIPCRPSAFDVAAIGATLNLLKVSKALDRTAILLNAAPPRGTITDVAEQGLSEIVPVVPVRMHQRAAYSHAINGGYSVEEFDPQGKAAEEIRALYKWIMKA